MKKFLGLLLILCVLAGGQLAAAQTAIDARVFILEPDPNNDGKVYVRDSTGTEENLAVFPAGIYDNWAKPCGQTPWPTGGQSVALYTGAASGDIKLYPFAAGGAPVSLGNSHRMACSGNGFQFSPDGSRAAYINYARDSLDRAFAYGTLNIYSTADGTQLATFDWTVSFQVYADGILMLRYYPDGKGNASEADVDWWDGSSRKTLVTLEPLYPPDKEDVECGLTSGSGARIGDTVYMMISQHCETGETMWRFVSVPMAGGALTEITSGTPKGGYFSGSFANVMIPSKDNTGFLIGVPSGLTRNSVGLAWITLAGVTSPVLEGSHILVDRYGERLSEGRHMIVSPNGSSLAFVSVNNNGEQTLYQLDLATLGNQPVLLQEEGANERIFQYTWSGDNKLFYATGDIESSSLLYVTPGTDPVRISRGRFFQIAVNYAGDKIAAAEWFANPERVGDDLFKLSVLDLSGNAVTFKEGGQEHNEIRPLAIQ